MRGARIEQNSRIKIKCASHYAIKAVNLLIKTSKFFLLKFITYFFLNFQLFPRILYKLSSEVETMCKYPKNENLQKYLHTFGIKCIDPQVRASQPFLGRVPFTFKC